MVVKGGEGEWSSAAAFMVEVKFGVGWAVAKGCSIGIVRGQKPQMRYSGEDSLVRRIYTRVVEYVVFRGRVQSCVEQRQMMALLR